jgi:hypothetical protein
MAQSGLFTCHKMSGEDGFVELTKHMEYKTRLIKIVIPGFKFSSIREQARSVRGNRPIAIPRSGGLSRFLD